jgi:hypothetical protein
MITGVLVTFFWNLTVTPAGISTVVKLKIPLGGIVNVVFAVGLNAPSAPVLPLTKPAALASDAINAIAKPATLIPTLALSKCFTSTSFNFQITQFFCW